MILFLLFIFGSVKANPYDIIESNAPVNSFGGTGDIQVVNWTYLEDNVYYTTNADELEIEFNGSDLRKYKYKLKIIESGNYYLNIIWDTKIDDVEYYSSNYTVVAHYDGGDIIYNYSDIVLTTDWIVDYSLTDGVFYLFLDKYLDVNIQEEWELDPWFGNQFVGVITSPVEGVIKCGHFKMGSDNGVLDNITIYFVEGGVYVGNVKAFIYDESLNYIGDSVTDAFQGSSGWQTLNANGTVNLVANQWYFIGAAAEVAANSLNIRYNFSGGYGYLTDNGVTFGISPDPIQNDSYDVNNLLSMYASYTVSAGGCSDDLTFSGESPTNSSSGISICPDGVNFSVAIANDCGLSDMNISILFNGQWKNYSSVGNGTYWNNQIASNLSCDTTYDIDVLVNVNNSQYWENVSYNFDTVLCCDTTIEVVNYTNGTSVNRSWMNFSAYINSSCNNTLSFVNFSLPFFGNYSNQTGIGEGLVYANFTNLSMVCSSNYTWWINASSDNCSSSHRLDTWYYFVTTACVVTNQTPYIVDFNPSNNSCCNNYNPFRFNITVNDNETDLMRINISYNATNYSLFNNVYNGTYWHNVTLNCSMSININVSVNDSYGNYLNVSYNFDTTACSINLSDCVACFNDTNFTDSLENYLITNGYIKESDNVEISLDATFITLLLFALFFIIGYTQNKKSGGVLMVFSGFILLALEYLLATALDNLIVVFMSPIAILIILLGVRKWLYSPEGEKTKSEGN
jgi:hypothetical protein